MNEFKIVTWNIRQGGKKAKSEIIASLISRHADVIVLTEFRNNETGTFLLTELKKAGWPYIQISNEPGYKNGIAIVSTHELAAVDPPFSKKHGSHRWNEVYIPKFHFFLLGLHVPNVGEKFDKQFFWKHILNYADQRQNARAMIIGDFNSVRIDEKETGDRKYSRYIMTLIENGWEDAWKHMHPDCIDYSWFSHKQNGFRLDYLFLSPELLPALASCDFSHEERKKNFSDHSLLTSTLKE